MVLINAIVATMMATAAMALPHGHHHLDTHQKRATTSSKRGVAYNDASVVSLIPSASWAYDWNLDSDGTLPSGIDYCPMLWGAKMFSGWQAAATSAIQSGSTCLLGFNEPDNAGQANMSPEDAATAYQQYITPFSGQATLVTPAVTNGEGDDVGLNWLESFFQACSGNCKTDVVAVHYYADAGLSDFQTFVNSAINVANKYGKNSVWVTEFQNTGDAASQVSFLQEAIPWLESTAGVGRYAYFYAADGYLLSDSTLSTIGEAYTASS